MNTKIGVSWNQTHSVWASLDCVRGNRALSRRNFQGNADAVGVILRCLRVKNIASCSEDYNIQDMDD
jgi:hypothetical protein